MYSTSPYYAVGVLKCVTSPKFYPTPHFRPRSLVRPPKEQEARAAARYVAYLSRGDLVGACLFYADYLSYSTSSLP